MNIWPFSERTTYNHEEMVDCQGTAPSVPEEEVGEYEIVEYHVGKQDDYE